jgi:RimJ/RimL family protein N-acetyltransferase
VSREKPFAAALDYPPLNVVVRTPRLELRGATDELLALLAPVVRDGVVDPDEAPFDDPMSLYADGPEREWRWLRGIWAGRARVDPQSWRLYFVVMVGGVATGMQDVIGQNFDSLGTVGTFSWLAPAYRGRGLGTEMRAAAIELAFAGLGAREASSDAFVDNAASNRVSQALGYEPNGTEWATRRGEPALMLRWKLTRERWESRRREDITLVGVDPCRAVLGLPRQEACR